MARLFNGTSDVATVTINLSGANAVTVSAWMYRTSNPASRIIFEYGGTNGFDVVSNGLTDIVRSYGAVAHSHTYTTPSFNVWHHYLWIIKGGPNGTHFNKAIIDGSFATMTSGTVSTENIAWANSTLTIGGRVGSAFMPCTIAEFAIWNGVALTTTVGPPKDTAAGLYSGWTPPHLYGIPNLYIPMWGDSPEPDYSGSHTPAVLTGTTFANHPPTKTLLMP